MEDKLITLETAKLAKEKGFNESCNLFYHTTGLLDNAINHNTAMGMKNDFSAPTQSLLQKWLREVHNIHCNANVNFFNKKKMLGYYYTIDKFNKDNIHDGIDYDINQVNLIGAKEGYDTYEEALEIGLIETLKLIE